MSTTLQADLVKSSQWADIEKTSIRHVWPKFSHALSHGRAKSEVYLANHSLGRQLDQTQIDVQEGLTVWQEQMDESWSNQGWMGEIERFKSNIAKIVGLPGPECIVPKNTATQGLRAVLNSMLSRKPLKVVSTLGEFDSSESVLKIYQEAGLVEVEWVKPTRNEQNIELFEPGAIVAALKKGCDLLVVSLVFFQTAQILPETKAIIEAAHQVGALVVLDVYHAAGAIPVDLIDLKPDFAVGGCYKYLRGGPGAGYLAIHPNTFSLGLKTLDGGWFAKENPFAFQQTESIKRGPMADGWMESTFPALIPYQARAGLEFALEVGIEGIRAHSLAAQNQLQQAFVEANVSVFQPADPNAFAAFSLIHNPNARQIVEGLRHEHVIADARGTYIRFCPDFLNTEEDFKKTAKAVSDVVRDLGLESQGP